MNKWFQAVFLSTLVLCSLYTVSTRIVSSLRTNVSTALADISQFSDISHSSRYALDEYTLIINTTQTWYGDFTVNATDKVLVENCNFTVRNGQIAVYGTLNIDNSTISIHDSIRKRKAIIVNDGNLTISRSTILGDNVIVSQGNSRIHIIDSWSPTTCCSVLDASAEVTVESSTTRYFFVFHGSLSMTNSSCDWVILHLQKGSRFLSQNSSIGYIALDPQQSSGELELKGGLNEELRIDGQSGGGNCTVINSWVEEWDIYGNPFGGTIRNSQIRMLSFMLDPTWSGNLTLNSAHIEYLNLSFAATPLIISNSTVKEYYIGFDRGDHRIEICDSENLILAIDTRWNIDLKLLDSHIKEICFEDFQDCNLTATNTTIDSIFSSNEGDWSDIQLDRLTEGFQENYTLLFPERGFNITLTNSSVNHWGTMLYGGGRVLTISDSTLTDETEGFSLQISNDASCFVQNSQLGSIYCVFQGHLTLTNCSVNTLYVYSDSDVTAINSTIGMVITDPVQITLINSTVLLATDFSFEMDAEDKIQLTCSEECYPSLSSTRFSDYMNITTAYSAYFEAQIKIFYNETRVEESGVNASLLQIYYLSESNVWQSCPIQGVDTANNYVWANVTHFSCFVLGASNALVGDINSDGEVDIKDVSFVARRFGITPGHPLWDPVADLNEDNLIDIKDVSTVARHFGEVAP